jgi:hypothetical protein
MVDYLHNVRVVVLHCRLIFTNLLKQVSAKRNVEIDAYTSKHFILSPEIYQSDLFGILSVSLFNLGLLVPPINNRLNTGIFLIVDIYDTNCA